MRMIAILSALCLSAAAAYAPPALAETGTLSVQLKADIRSTDPGTNRDENTDMVVQQMVEGLVAFREDTSVGMMLAKSVDTSPDGLTYTFTLREGVHFHNGAPLTANDVVFAWKRYLDPKTAWRCLPEFDGRGITKILSVEAPNPSTIVFKLEKASALFLTMMARTDCGASGIYHRASLGDDGKWKELIGTGPFKMGEWKKGQSIELTKFDGYSALPDQRDGLAGNKTVLVDKVRFSIIPDASAAKAALMRGDIDVLVGVSDADRPDLVADKDVIVSDTPGTDFYAILFQVNDPVLKDPRIRQAIALALDLPQLVTSVKGGLAKANRSPIPSISPYYDADQAKVPAQNIDAAKKLLAEAGYKGQPIKLIANKGYPVMFDQAVLAQAMAQQAGINLELEVMDWATELDHYTKGTYQAMSFAYSGRLDPSLSFEVFTGPKATQPRKLWDDPKAQGLLVESMQETDHAKRQAVFDQMIDKLREDLPIICLFSNVTTDAVRKNVEGYKGWAIIVPRLWGMKLKS